VNKNFKKLLEQSYSKAFEECIQRGHQVKQIDAIFNSIAMDEFAELIVKETVLEVWIQLFNHGIDLSENTLFLEAMKKTKEHFGVEE
jgi:hypothetical protein